MFGVYSQQGGASITLNEIIITGSSGDISTSLDGGLTWTTITVGSGTIDSIIWGNDEFVLLRNRRFYTSPDGINWTYNNVAMSLGINKFIYADGLYFVIIGGANATNLCTILARESFNSGGWTTVYTAPTTGYIDTLTYYDGRVYFIYQTTTSPTFHSILISDLTVTDYGVMNSGLGAIRLRYLYRVYNGWVARSNTNWTIAFTTTNTGWGISTNVHYGGTFITVSDTTFTPARDYLAIFATNSAGNVGAGATFDGNGNTGTNSMRNFVTNVFSDGTYFYCYDTAATAGVYRRLITDWSGAWMRDANATTAGINGNMNGLMATGGTPNNVYISVSSTLYKTVSGSSTYTNLGAHSGTLRFVGRI